MLRSTQSKGEAERQPLKRKRYQEDLSRLEEEIIQRRTPEWEEELKNGRASEEIETEKQEVLARTRKLFEEANQRMDGLIRIEKMLEPRYGSEFAHSIYEIDVGSVTTQEITNLVITLQKMFHNTSEQPITQQSVIEKMEPLIAKNPNRIREQLEKIQHEYEEEKRRADAIEQQIKELQAQLQQGEVPMDQQQTTLLVYSSSLVDSKTVEKKSIQNLNMPRRSD